MAYAYDSLEKALELAVYRAPVAMIGALIEKVEYVISNNQDASILERELLDVAGVGVARKIFNTAHLEREGAFDLAKAA